MGDVPDGWAAAALTAFERQVGPLYHRPAGSPGEAGFLADERHANTRGVVHGGMVVSAFDMALGLAAKHAASDLPCATLQLDVQFASAMNLGEFAVVGPEVVRATASVVFMRGTLTVGDRLVATASGVWKILRPRTG